MKHGFWIFFFQILDCLTTQVGLTMGAQEFNPFHIQAVQSFWGYLLYKLICATFIFLFLQSSKDKGNIFKYFSRAYYVGMAIVCVNNLIVIGLVV